MVPPPDPNPARDPSGFDRMLVDDSALVIGPIAGRHDKLPFRAGGKLQSTGASDNVSCGLRTAGDRSRKAPCRCNGFSGRPGPGAELVGPAPAPGNPPRGSACARRERAARRVPHGSAQGPGRAARSDRLHRRHQHGRTGGGRLRFRDDGERDRAIHPQGGLETGRRGVSGLASSSR